MGGSGGVGQKISQAKQEKDAKGRAQKITESVGLGMGTVRGKDEADHDDFRAEQDAQSQRGADGQSVKHGSDCGGWVFSGPLTDIATVDASGSHSSKG